MLVGAAIYAEAYPAMKMNVLTWGSFGRMTLSQILGVSPWLVVTVLVVLYLLLFAWFEKRRI
jgi:hypothetical protein